ncbi:unnamed protein product [Arctogadus glacialis]
MCLSVCLSACPLYPPVCLLLVTANSSGCIFLCVCLSTCVLSDCLCCHSACISCLSVHPICRFVCLSVSLSLPVSCLSLSLHLSDNLSVSIRRYFCLSACLPIMCLSACFVCIPVYLSACLSVRLPAYTMQKRQQSCVCMQLVVKLSMRST